MTRARRARARARGRPRSAEADEAILDAAIEAFAEHGFDGLTVDAVAAPRRRQQGHDLPALPVATRPRPGRGRARRRGDGCRSPTPGTLARRPAARSIEAYLGLLTGTPVGRGDSRCWSPRRRATPSWRVAHADVRRSSAGGDAAHRLERAIARGELRADVDLQLALDLLVGAALLPAAREPHAGRRRVRRRHSSTPSSARVALTRSGAGGSRSRRTRRRGAAPARVVHRGAAARRARARRARDVLELGPVAQHAVQPAVHEVPGAHVRRLLLHPAHLRGVRVARRASRGARSSGHG